MLRSTFVYLDSNLFYIMLWLDECKMQRLMSSSLRPAMASCQIYASFFLLAKPPNVLLKKLFFPNIALLKQSNFVSIITFCKSAAVCSMIADIAMHLFHNQREWSWIYLYVQLKIRTFLFTVAFFFCRCYRNSVQFSQSSWSITAIELFIILKTFFKQCFSSIVYIGTITNIDCLVNK